MSCKRYISAGNNGAVAVNSARAGTIHIAFLHKAIVGTIDRTQMHILIIVEDVWIGKVS